MTTFGVSAVEFARVAARVLVVDDLVALVTKGQVRPFSFDIAGKASPSVFRLTFGHVILTTCALHSAVVADVHCFVSRHVGFTHVILEHPFFALAAWAMVFTFTTAPSSESAFFTAVGAPRTALDMINSTLCCIHSVVVNMLNACAIISHILNFLKYGSTWEVLCGFATHVCFEKFDWFSTAVALCNTNSSVCCNLLSDMVYKPAGSGQQTPSLAKTLCSGPFPRIHVQFPPSCVATHHHYFGMYTTSHLVGYGHCHARYTLAWFNTLELEGKLFINEINGFHLDRWQRPR
jgi:hypothetical protein